jgi:hypothetical protein
MLARLPVIGVTNIYSPQVLTNRPLYNRPPPKDNELLWFDIDYVVLTSNP